MTDAVPVYGTTVERSTDGVSYIEIPGLNSVPIPVATQEMADITTLSSPNGAREKLPTLIDYGTISPSGIYTPEGFAMCRDDMFNARAAKSPIYYRITMPLADSQSTSGDVVTFRGYPTPKVEGSDIAGAYTMTLEIIVTGDVTFAEGA
jgi:hypothetical protein